MVTPALDVERGEIETIGAWGAEQEVTYVVDNEGIDRLCCLAREPEQQRVNAVGPYLAGFEEGVLERDVGDGPIVVESQQLGESMVWPNR